MSNATILITPNAGDMSIHLEIDPANAVPFKAHKSPLPPLEPGSKERPIVNQDRFVFEVEQGIMAVAGQIMQVPTQPQLSEVLMTFVCGRYESGAAIVTAVHEYVEFSFRLKSESLYSRPSLVLAFTSEHRKLLAAHPARPETAFGHHKDVAVVREIELLARNNPTGTTIEPMSRVYSLPRTGQSHLSSPQ